MSAECICANAIRTLLSFINSFMLLPSGACMQRGFQARENSCARARKKLECMCICVCARARSREEDSRACFFGCVCMFVCDRACVCAWRIRACMLGTWVSCAHSHTHRQGETGVEESSPAGKRRPRRREPCKMISIIIKLLILD